MNPGGWELAKKSWSLVRRKPVLVFLPMISMSLWVVAGTAIFFYAYDRPWWSYPLALAVVYFPITVVATFFGVVFVAMARHVIDGEEATLRGGLACAVERLPQVFGWALAASIVGVVVSTLQHLRGGWFVELVASWLLSLAWAAASFFAIPILVAEGRGPLQTLRRSVGLVKRRWGEGVVGVLSIVGATVAVLLPAIVVFIIGFVVFESNEVVGAAIMALAAISYGLTVALSTAVTQMFQLVLYRYATAGEVVGPFDVDDFESAFKTRSRRGLFFWRDL